jgi:hypothetical protein
MAGKLHISDPTDLNASTSPDVTFFTKTGLDIMDITNLKSFRQS